MLPEEQGIANLAGSSPIRYSPQPYVVFLRSLARMILMAGASSLELSKRVRATATSLRAPGNKCYSRITNPQGRYYSIQSQ